MNVRMKLFSLSNKFRNRVDVAKLKCFVACTQNVCKSGVFWPDITYLAIACLNMANESDESLCLGKICVKVEIVRPLVPEEDRASDLFSSARKMAGKASSCLVS
jgi:hypothetical protein